MTRPVGFSPFSDWPPCAAGIELRADDLKLVARALCHADGAIGAPCGCRGTETCPALDVYGDPARAVLAALEAMGRLAGSPVRLTPALVEGFFEANAREKGWLKPASKNPFDHGGGLALAEITLEDLEAYEGFQRSGA